MNPTNQPTNDGISATQLATLIDQKQDISLIDVREPDEFSNGHMRNSINIPLGIVIAGVADYKIPKDKPVVTICVHGVRSAKAQKILLSRNYDAKTLVGGLDGWEKKLGDKHLQKPQVLI